MYRTPEQCNRVIELWLNHTSPEGEGKTGGAIYGPMIALAMLRLGRRHEEAWQCVRSSLACQQRDKSDQRQGNFKDNPEAERVRDGNFGGFATCSLVPMVMEYEDQLPPDLLAEIKESFRLFLDGHRLKRPFGFNYTNSVLTGRAPALIIAEYLGDEEYMAYSRRIWNRIYQEIMTRGIQERNSDDYFTLSMIGLSITAAYSQFPECRRQAKDVFICIARELRFHGNRFPIPARRTYNQARGTAKKMSALDWYLGDCPDDPDDLPAWMGSLNRGADDANWFNHMAGWMAIAVHTFPKTCDPCTLEVGGAPRLITGRYIDDVSWASYYHPAYTVGAFSESPAGVAFFQHKSDLPAAFSGDERNLGFIGVYAVDTEDDLSRHPGGLADMDSRMKIFGPADAPSRPETCFASFQERNLLITLLDIEKLRGRVKELGVSVRVPDWTGRLLDEHGQPVAAATGAITGDWIFLDLEGALAAIYPLEVYDGSMLVERGPRPKVSYEITDEHGLAIHAQILADPEGIDLKLCQSGGFFTIMLATPDEQSLARTVKAVQTIKVEEDLFLDGFIIRDGFAEGERRIKATGSTWTIEMGFDMKSNRFTYRRYNGINHVCPTVLDAIQPGTQELEP